MALAGTRDRRKTETRAVLCTAALELVAEEGIDSVTADRVADRAGVSRRTLFNYFGRVEEVLTAGLEQTTAELFEDFKDRPDDESLRDSIDEIVGRLLASPAFRQCVLLERAASQSPSTRRFLLDFQYQQTRVIEQVLRQRLGAGTDPVYPAALAGAATGTFGAMVRLTVDAASDEDDVDTLIDRHQQNTRDALDLLFAGFDLARTHAHSSGRN